MVVTVNQTKFTDFEALQTLIQDNRSEIVQLGRGRMSGQMSHLSMGLRFGISTGTFSQGIRACGVVSDTRWMLGMMLHSAGPVLAHRHILAAGDLVMLAPKEDRYAAFHDATQYFAILITPEELEGFLGSQPGTLDLMRSREAVFAVAPEIAAANIEVLRPLLDGIIEHGPTMSFDVAEFHKRNILERLTMPLRESVHYQGGRLLSADRLVREIDGYLVRAGTRPVHVSELCEVFCVPRRSLFQAFHDVLGVPPITFLRRKRLGDVHRVLKQGGPADRVKRVAVEHGFLELGKFARDYRRQFSEKPSDTLRLAQAFPLH